MITTRYRWPLSLRLDTNFSLSSCVGDWSRDNVTVCIMSSIMNLLSDKKFPLFNTVTWETSIVWWMGSLSRTRGRRLYRTLFPRSDRPPRALTKGCVETRPFYREKMYKGISIIFFFFLISFWTRTVHVEHVVRQQCTLARSACRSDFMKITLEPVRWFIRSSRLTKPMPEKVVVDLLVVYFGISSFEFRPDDLWRYQSRAGFSRFS